MQTLVTYRFDGSLAKVVEMREYVENLGLKPKFVVDHLEITLVGHSCAPLESLGWQCQEQSVGDSHNSKLSALAPSLAHIATPTPLTAIKSGPQQVGLTYHVDEKGRISYKRTQTRPNRKNAPKTAWQLDKELKEKARANPKLNAPLAKPMCVAPNLIKEVEEHNKRTPDKSRRGGVWKQGITYEITLRSRRPSVIHLDCKCSNCREWDNVAHKYEESSHGVVYLCRRCNDILRERSFGSNGGDAMFAAYGRNKAR